MRKFFVSIFVFIIANITFAQTQVTVSPSINWQVDEWDGGSNYNQILGESNIGGNNQYHYYTLGVIDLEQQFGGVVTSLVSGNIQLTVSHTAGDHWGAFSIPSDLSNATPYQIVQSIKNNMTPTLTADNITLSISQLSIVSNKIFIGVLSDQYFRNYVVNISSGSITATVRLNVSLNVTYNQGSGNITAYIGSNPQSPSAPAHVTGHENDQMHIAPLSPTMPGYNLVYNETQAPLNKSTWKIYNENRYFTNQTLAPASNTFSMVKSQDNWTYEAQMKKLCNITFQNKFINIGNNGTITVNGTQYNSPASGLYVVEQNQINAVAAINYLFNGIIYNFQYWTDGNGNYVSSATNTTFNPINNNTYSANYIGKPENLTRNLTFGTALRQPITFTWTDNPNTNVTQYQIWRYWVYNGQQSTPALLGTVSRGVQNFTDNSFTLYDAYNQYGLYYDARPYYSTEGTYADPDYEFVPGKIQAKESANNNQNKSFNEEIVENYGLEQNTPNPFNPSTIINYQVPNAGFVSLKVYDLLGREVSTLVNEVKTQGKYSVTFDASNLTSGIYIYQLKSNGFSSVKKMVLMR
jgi:hypothetical protein